MGHFGALRDHLIHAMLQVAQVFFPLVALLPICRDLIIASVNPLSEIGDRSARWMA
jgi:hypothetical protein